MNKRAVVVAWLCSGCLAGGGGGGGGAPFSAVDGDAGVKSDSNAGADGGASDPGSSDAKPTDVKPASDAGGAPDSAKADSAPADVPKPAGGVVDPACLDGKYSETPPSTSADLAALKAGYTSAGANAFVIGVLSARYPIGAWLVQAGMVKQDCIGMFLTGSKKASAAGALSMLSTLVHECGHMADIHASGFGSSTYLIREDLKFSCTGGGHAGANQSFARSLLLKDEYAALRPPCPKQGPNGCDNYANIYLDGDPADGKFQGGDQGFSSVIEETTQYVNSLATDHAFADQSPFSISARDGILTFLWYTERYLRMARLQYPAVHSYLLGQPCWRQAVLTVWGRAWFYLQLTKGNPKLTIDGAKIEPLVLDPDLLGEIERVRIAEGCAAL